MSESDASPTMDDGQSNEGTRPQTVLLTKLRPQNSCSEEDTNIGDAFFLKHNNAAVDISKKSEENCIAKGNEINSHDSDGDTNHHNIENVGTNTAKERPKTVTKCRTDGYQRKLVDIGAVESNKPKPNQDQASLSPKPKSEKCYICGKEFLLSSLKIHEKQCTKKHEKTSKMNNKTTPAVGSSKVSKKPQLEACYLCGKEFFIHSLGIHETQCIKNWKAGKTPDAKDQTVSERTILEKQCNNFEQESTVANVQKEQISTTEEATKIQKSSSKLENKSNSPCIKKKGLNIIPCYLCGVAFLPHSLKIHEKKCRGQPHDLNQDNNTKTGEKDDAPLNPSTSEESFILEQEECFQNKSDPQNIHANNSYNTYISRKPKTIVCYICGQEFLKSSYAFHEKKCASMNESMTAEETPLQNSKVNSTRCLGKPKTIICYICGEEFLKSSYTFHEKKCATMVQNTQEKETMPEGSKEKIKTESSCKTAEATKDNENSKNSLKPRTIVCYICGQEFLKSSYAFHEKQCASKNRKVEDESQNEKTTPNVGSTEKENQSSNSERPETPRRKPKTQPCYVCGKEMLLSSLKIHEQQCQKKTEILKNINQQKLAAQKRTGRQVGTAKDKHEAKPKTQMCYICGETFLTSSIKVHEAQCEKRWNGKT